MEPDAVLFIGAGTLLMWLVSFGLVRHWLWAVVPVVVALLVSLPLALWMASAVDRLTTSMGGLDGFFALLVASLLPGLLVSTVPRLAVRVGLACVLLTLLTAFVMSFLIAAGQVIR